MPDSGSHASVVRRLKSLDVLRAAAILLMIFSGMLPKTLPNWMDHGYNAHFLPDAQGNWSLRPEVTAGKNLFLAGWSSFTWVDLVFPMFLFSMGASIPIALSRLTAARRSATSIVGHILGRWLMLILFAVLVTHLSPHFLQSSVPNAGRIVVLASFLLAFLFFLRWPPETPRSAQRIARGAAFAGIAALIIAYAVRNGTAFSWARSDTIILVLAQTYLVASIAWLLTQRHLGVRFVVLVPFMLLAHYLQFRSPELASRQWMGAETFALLGPPTDAFLRYLNLPAWIIGESRNEAWNQYILPLFDLSPLWRFSWYKYLWVVIPGTIVGDLLRIWSTRAIISANPFEREAGRPRISRLALPVSVLLCIAIFIGLRHTGYPLMGVGGALQTPWLALLLGLPLLAVLGCLVLPKAYGSLWICRKLFHLGSAFLIVGLLLTCLPNFVTGEGYFEGGISKGPPATLSYYFVSVGLCTLLLLSLTARLDYEVSYGTTSSLLGANGQNPLLAYFLAHTAFAALLTLTLFDFFDHPFGPDIKTLDDYFSGYLRLGPWLLACWAAVKTLVLALVVWAFSANRLFWRA